MNLLSDVITYVRRLLKQPSQAQITDALIIDYINRFVIMDIDARIQLFDYKTTYEFLTSPGVDRYNMPLYDLQVEPGGLIYSYPVYQGFEGPVFINGIECSFSTQRETFNNIYPNYVQTVVQAGTGNGTSGPYTLTLPFTSQFSNTVSFPYSSGIIRGHVDITGIIAEINAIGANQDPPIDTTGDGALIPIIPVTSVSPAVYFTSSGENGANVTISDSGIFLDSNVNLGLLMNPGKAPNGNQALSQGYKTSFNITGATQANPCVLTCSSNFSVGQSIFIDNVVGMTELNGNTYTVTAVDATTVTINVNSIGFGAYVSGGTASTLTNLINYVTGIAQDVFFPDSIPSGMPINASCVFYQLGIPRSVLYYNNTLTLRAPPNTQYLVSMTAFLTPAAFLASNQALPFAYMAEYLSRGAARKILADTGDVEQFNFYEPLFREQEILVWKRSQRQWTSTRTQTIYSQGVGQGNQSNNFGLGAM